MPMILHPIQSLRLELGLLTFMSLVAYVIHWDLGLSLRPMSLRFVSIPTQGVLCH